jgi:hypothetical protein
VLLKEIGQLEVSEEETEVDLVEEVEVDMVEEIEEDLEQAQEIQETPLSFLVKMIKTPKKVPLEPSKVKK